MRARILTLRFSPTLDGFDDSPLQEFVRDKQVLGCREHIVHVEGLPYIACVVTWLGAAASQGAGAEPPEPDTAACAPKDDHRAAARDRAPALQGPRRRIFDAMRRWRAATAHREGVPSYVILTTLAAPVSPAGSRCS